MKPGSRNRFHKPYADCSRCRLDLSLRSAAYVAGWLDDPDAVKTGMAAIHDGAAPSSTRSRRSCQTPPNSTWRPDQFGVGG